MSNETLPFGDWLRRQIVDRLDVSQAEFARSIDVEPSTVSRWISGRSSPDPTSYRRLAERLSLRIEEVLYYAGIRPELPQPLDEYERERLLRQMQHDLDRGFRQMQEVERGGRKRSTVRFYGRVPADSMRWTNAGEEGSILRVLDDWLGTRSAKEFFVVEAAGDCLSERPYGILSGFYVLLRRSPNDQPTNGEVVLIRVGNEYSLKVWHRDDDWIELKDSFGTTIHRMSIFEDFELVGRYVTHWKPIPGNE